EIENNKISDDLRSSKEDKEELKKESRKVKALLADLTNSIEHLKTMKNAYKSKIQLASDKLKQFRPMTWYEKIVPPGKLVKYTYHICIAYIILVILAFLLGRACCSRQPIYN